MLKLAILVLAVKGGALALPNVNTVLNALTFGGILFGLVWFGPKYYKMRDLQAQLAAKDRTIATDAQTKDSFEDRIQALEADLVGAQERAAKLHERNAKLSEVAHVMQGRYEEQSKYTAKEALEALKDVLAHQSQEAERRHLELMSALSTIGTTGA